MMMSSLSLTCLVAAAVIVLGLSSGARLDDTPGGAAGGSENVLESVADTEKRLKKLVNSGVKFALPYVMSTVTEIKMKTGCMRGLMKLMRGVMDIKDWAVRMVDALGKPSAGILEGTATAMGDYDECLDIMVPKNVRTPSSPPYTEKELDYQGQYCVVQIHIPESIRQAAMAYQAGNRSNSDLANSNTFLKNFVKIGPRADIADLRLGVCIPSTCELNDLQAIVEEVSRMVMIKATTVRCKIKGSVKLTVEQIIVLSVIGFMALLVFVGTLTEAVILCKSEEQINDTFFMNKGKMMQSVLTFSAITNAKRLFSLKRNDTPVITSLRGLKFISVCLYVVVWTYATPQDFHFLKYRSAFHFYKFMEEWWFTVFANASAGIDTLFLIAGLQVTYGLWKKSNGGKVKISIPKFILKWFLRFALCQLIVIGLFLCLPLIGNGPIWEDVVTPVINNCKQRWWLNVLAINNFWPTNDMCLPHTWLLCSLMHMLFFAPVVLYILSKWTPVGIFVNLIIILGSSVAIAMVTLMKDLPPAPAFYFLSFINIKTIWDKLFIQAYDHASPFCVGMLLGFTINRYSKIKLRKTTVVVGWCSAIACNLAVMCGLYGYRHGEAMEITLSAIYASVHRLGWSLGIAWIIFACAYGYGGFVNNILSWKYFIPLEKISNLTYLLHPLILFLHEGQLRERMYMAHLDQAMYATAYIVFTVAISALIYITCCSPFFFFEKLLWKKFSAVPCQLEAKRACIEVSVKSTVTDLHLSKEQLKHGHCSKITFNKEDTKQST